MSYYYLALLIFGLIVFGAFIFITWYGIKNLFPGSGDPANVSRSFSEITKNYSQLILGLFVVLVITALLLEKIVSPESGLPIISLIVGYILGSRVNSMGKQ